MMCTKFSSVNIINSSKVPNQWYNEMAESSTSQASNHARKESQVNTYVEITKYKLIHYQMHPTSTFAFNML